MKSISESLGDRLLAVATGHLNVILSNSKRKLHKTDIQIYNLDNKHPKFENKTNFRSFLEQYFCNGRISDSEEPVENVRD